ncbi:MAG: hypothetical protein R3F48_03185 [Candidatus Zixiibacteriota bacterium]
MKKLLVLMPVYILLAIPVLAQTTINPDISLIGDFRSFVHNDISREVQNEKLTIESPSLELVVAGNLNPYAKANATLAWHGEENAEIEEAFFTIHRGLPLRTNLRVGKYLLEFGRLNTVHEHAWLFIKRPLPHTAFFGDHGLSDMAVRTSFLLPTGDLYTELMVGVLKGDALMGHHHDHEEEEADIAKSGEQEDEATYAERTDPGFFGRLTTSHAVGEYSELAFGVSALNAVYIDETCDETIEAIKLRSWLLGSDVKFKYKPSRYTALQLEGELILRRAEQESGNDLNSLGGYGCIDYRFRQKYNIGGIAEYVKEKALHEHEGEHEIEETTTWRTGLFVGFAPIEETTLVRLAGHWTEPDEGGGFWEATLQLVFSLGPHQPHNF